MDYLGAAPRSPGRCPSLEERLGLRPACCSACGPGLPERHPFLRPHVVRRPLVWILPASHLWRASKCSPQRGAGSPSKGQRPGCRRRSRPHRFSTPVLRPNGPTVLLGPLGRKRIENGRMDCLWTATRLPGRRPSLEERLGLRPAGGSACGPGLPRTPSVPSTRMLSGGSRMDFSASHLWRASKCSPRRGGGSSSEGRRPGCKRRSPPHHFFTSVLRPNGPTVLLRRDAFSGRRRPAKSLGGRHSTDQISPQGGVRNLFVDLAWQSLSR
jgi:hypothetical protein